MSSFEVTFKTFLVFLEMIASVCFMLCGSIVLLFSVVSVLFFRHWIVGIEHAVYGIFSMLVGLGFLFHSMCFEITGDAVIYNSFRRER